MRSPILFLSSALLAFLVFCEVVIAMPAPRWMYFLTGAGFAAALIRGTPLREQRRPLGILALVLVSLVILHQVDWTTRKPFLRDLERIQPGMTEAEVRSIMAGYLEGTGWPSFPDAPQGAGSQPAGTLTDLGSGSTHATGTDTNGKLVLKGSLVFRHSRKGQFDSDWGIIALVSNRVVGVEFSPD